MKFSVLSDEMNFGLGMTVRAVPARAIYPSMEGVFIETDESALRLTCTNGEMTVRCRVNAQIETEGCALLPAKLFGEIVRKQNNGQVVVEVNDDLKTVIRSGRSKTNMMGMDADDFPDICDVDTDNRIVLPCSVARTAISRVLFAVSGDEARKILTGVLMEATDDNVLFLGLDGFRMALQRVENKNGLPENKKGSKLSCVIPGTVMTEISRMLPDDSEKELEIMFSSSHVRFTFDDVCVYATLLTGEFIDYNKILPQSSTTVVYVSRSELSDAIDRCSLMAREGKNNLIHLSVSSENGGNGEGTIVMTSNAERGDVHEEIAVSIEGNPLDIAFNAKYLNDVVHNVDDDVMVMCLNTNVSPCMIRPREGDRYRFLVLPVRVFNK